VKDRILPAGIVSGGNPSTNGALVEMIVNVKP
jgi:hypothetical protein